MSPNQKIARVKKHLSDNKKTYIACGATALVSVGVTALVVPKNVGFNVAWAWKQEVSQNMVQTVLKPQMHPGIKVIHDQTGVAYPSVRNAAKALGLKHTKIYDYLQGKIADVDGNTFTNAGVMVWELPTQ
jgi:hypothetical protein